MICSSGIGFDPVLDGVRLIFGFHGIWQGTAVLYDQQSDSLWMHLTGTCFEGRHAGHRLTRLDTGRHTTWADWLGTHPDTEVLAQDPRYVDRDSDQGYFPREAAHAGGAHMPRQFLPTVQTRSRRLPPYALCYGVRVGGVARAYPFERLRDCPAVGERVRGVDVTVWFDPRSRSAAAFEARRDGRVMTFLAFGEGRFCDGRTKSIYTMDGVCVEGPQKGACLKPLDGLMTEWYGWYAHHPETTIWEP